MLIAIKGRDALTRQEWEKPVRIPYDMKDFAVKQIFVETTFTGQKWQPSYAFGEGSKTIMHFTFKKGGKATTHALVARQTVNVSPLLLVNWSCSEQLDAALAHSVSNLYISVLRNFACRFRNAVAHQLLLLFRTWCMALLPPSERDSPDRLSRLYIPTKSVLAWLLKSVLAWLLAPPRPPKSPSSFI